jgi:hypothetical protein
MNVAEKFSTVENLREMKGSSNVMASLYHHGFLTRFFYRGSDRSFWARNVNNPKPKLPTRNPSKAAPAMPVRMTESDLTMIFLLF